MGLNRSIYVLSKIFWCVTMRGYQLLRGYRLLQVTSLLWYLFPFKRPCLLPLVASEVLIVIKATVNNLHSSKKEGLRRPPAVWSPATLGLLSWAEPRSAKLFPSWSGVRNLTGFSAGGPQATLPTLTIRAVALEIAPLKITYSRYYSKKRLL